MVQSDYWLLQLMSQFRDRVRGRAPLLLVLSGALLMVMGGWPGQCTALPKELLLSAGRNASPGPATEATISGGSQATTTTTVHNDQFSVTLSGDGEAGEQRVTTSEMKSEYEDHREVTPSSREQQEDHHHRANYHKVTSSTTPVIEVPRRRRGRELEGDNFNMRILSRTDRSVSSINSRRGGGVVHSNSGLIRSNSNNSRPTRGGGSSSSGGGGGVVGTNRTRSGSNHLERNERSANLSHITSKIQLFIKNRLLQILPDGTVNGTQDDASDYTILQRTSVDVGKIKLQSVATCLFLCMDACGNAFASRDFTEDCVFNEAMELHHYNTYSSAKHSNSRRILYLALNRHGQTRKIHIPITRSLGKLSTYTNALTHTVDEKITVELLARLFGANHVLHGLKKLCETPKVHLRPLAHEKLIPRPKCLMNEKLAVAAKKGPALSLPGGGPKKHQQQAPKKKQATRRCKGAEVDEDGGEVNANAGGDCIRPTPIQILGGGGGSKGKKGPQRPGGVGIHKCPPGDENCQQQQQQPKKANKRRLSVPGGGGMAGGGGKGGNSNLNGKKKRGHGGSIRTITTTTVATVPTTTTEEDDMDGGGGEDEAGGGSMRGGNGGFSTELVDDLADIDSSIIPAHHHLRHQQHHQHNRLASSLADEDEAYFD